MLPIDFMGEDVVEVIGSHETIIVKVSLYKNMLNFFVVKVFSKVFGNFLELMGGYLSLNVIKWLQLC